MAEHITDALVKGLEAPATGNRIVYDGEHKKAVAGFGIRITAAGARSFILNYRNQEGRERRYTIGTYGPNEWSVEAARKRAGELKKAIGRGDDPLAEKVETRQAPTVADLCDRYIEDHLPRKRASSAADDRQMLKAVIRPKLGSRKVAAVQHSDIDKLHRELKATPYRANRVLALLSKMFSLAMRWGMRADNPCKGVERYPEAKRTRYLSADEFKRLSEALAAYPDKAARLAATEHPGNKEAVARARTIAERTTFAIGLCTLTGCRIGEALAATWHQFDLATGIWVKPASTTKQKAEHRVPLSDAALALIERIREAAPKGDDGEPAKPYLFPAARGDGFMPYRFALMAWHDMRKTAKLKDVRPHDLRHSFASILAARGGSLPLIGALLGHSNPATTARYAHLFDAAQRDGANLVGKFVTDATGIVPAPKNEKVA